MGCMDGGIISNEAVHCAGYRACLSTDITARTVYCSGHASCDRTIFVSDGDMDIYFLGYQSSNNAQLSCTEGDICTVHFLSDPAVTQQYYDMTLSGEWSINYITGLARRTRTSIDYWR